MRTRFVSYKVKIRPVEFISENGKVYSSMVKMSFYDKNKQELEYIECGYIDSEDIFKMIDNKEDVIIDNCFVENFSLKEYRKSRNLKENETIELHNFSAENSYFDSKIESKFTFAKFLGKTNFRYANFIDGSVDFHSSYFESDCDFTYIHFNNGNVNFNACTFGKGTVSFKNTIFKSGFKDFQDIDFGAGKVEFINTEFNDGDVSFISANFNDSKVSFKISRFGTGLINFHFAKFGKKDVTFERAEFGNGKIIFKTVEFGVGKVNFNRAVFGNGDISFEASQLLDGKMTFKKSIFGEGHLSFNIVEFFNSDLIFDNTIFGQGNNYFSESKFRNLSFRSCHLDSYYDLRLSDCKHLDLSDTIVRDIIDLTPYKTNVNIDIIDFSSMRLLGSIYIDWYKNNVYNLINNQIDTSDRIKAEQFRILKENFNRTGQYMYEDNAYIEFKRFELNADFLLESKKGNFNKILNYPPYIFKLVVFDKAGLYATDPARVLLSMLISYFIFSMLYVFTNMLGFGSFSVDEGTINLFSQIGKSFYFSAITYLTVGYGDICPVGGVDKWLAAIEGFVGVFLMSYFTVAFVRKILR